MTLCSAQAGEFSLFPVMAPFTAGPNICHESAQGDFGQAHEQPKSPIHSTQRLCLWWERVPCLAQHPGLGTELVPPFLAPQGTPALMTLPQSIPRGYSQLVYPTGAWKTTTKTMRAQKQLRKELGPVPWKSPPEQRDVSCLFLLGWGWALPMGGCL